MPDPLHRSRFALVVALALVGACGGDVPGEGEPADLAAAPAIDERLAAWEALPEGTAVPVALGFGRPIPDSAVAQLLERSGLRPFVVHFQVGDAVGSLTREQSRASLEILTEAREQTMSQLRTTVCSEQGRARGLLEETQGGDGVERYRQLLSQFLRARRLLPEVRMGVPIVYGVEAVGLLSEVRAVRSEPLVVSYEPGWVARVRRVDTVLVPTPPAPASPPPPIEPEIAALTPDEVRARMTALASDEDGTCQDGFRPDDPSALEGAAPPPP